MVKNPNAVAAVVSAGGFSQIVLEVSSWFGWSISTGLAIWIAAALAGAWLFVGREGLVGVWNFVKHGGGNEKGLALLEVLVVLLVVAVVILFIRVLN